MDVVFPARDQAIARVVANLSEPDSGRAADNLVTNEDAFARVCSDLRSHVADHGVYLGVGPDQNLTYLAHARPKLAFILDYRRRNTLLHLLHKALFALSPDRIGYLSRLIAREPRKIQPISSAESLVTAFDGVEMDRARLDATIASVADYLRPLHLVHDDEWADLATIQSKLAGPGLNARFLALTMYPTFGRMIKSVDLSGKPAHFLARDDWYEAVRMLQLGDRVIPLVGNFAGPHSLASTGIWLHQRGLAISAFYASDVEFFLLRSGQFDAYITNLAALPWRDGAVVIRTSTREIAHPERRPGDSSTTILRPVQSFLESARAGRIKSVDDLFR